MLKLRYPQLQNGLVGDWCPNLGYSGSLLLDRSGYGNHGTLTNMDPATDWVVSEGKMALDFDGVNDHVPNLKIDLTKSHSIATWAYSRNAYNSGLIQGILGSQSPPAPSYDLLLLYGGSVYSGAHPDGRYSATATPDNWPSGRWFHVCNVVQSGSSTTLYIDGKLIGSSAVSTFTYTGFLSLGFFTYLTSEYYSGMIDDLRFYNRAISPSEVATLALRRGIAHETYRVPVVRGSSVGGRTAVLSATLEGVTASATAAANIDASLTATLEGATAASSVASLISAGVLATLDGVTVISAATVGNAPGEATLSATLEGVTSSATAAVTVSAGLSATLEGVSGTSAAAVLIAAGVSATLDGVSVVSTATVGNVPGQVTLSATLEGVTGFATSVVLIEAGVSATLEGATAVSSAVSLITAGVTATLEGVTLFAMAGDGEEDDGGILLLMYRILV